MQAVGDVSKVIQMPGAISKDTFYRNLSISAPFLNCGLLRSIDFSSSASSICSLNMVMASSFVI
jgi:hypothetical protein